MPLLKESGSETQTPAHPPTSLPVTASTVAAQSLGTGLVSKQRSQASNETKVWDSLLVLITKKLFLLCFHKCINKAVKASWIAKLFLASFCLHSLFYRTRRNLAFFFFLEVLLGEEFSIQSEGIRNIQCKIILKLEINSIVRAFMYLDINVLMPEVLNLFR